MLYIHIPFCVRKCLYCDFLSFPSDEETIKRYVEALKKEIVQTSTDTKLMSVRSLFIGGGTPTVLGEDLLEQILNMVFRCFNVKRDAEITIECNPGTADENKLSVLKANGVNRVSIGAQSFNDKHLKTIGRIHDSMQIVKTCELIKKCGFDNFNVDLMSALPYSDLKDWEESVNKAVQTGATHISAYSLILEEGTPLYDRQDEYTFPDEDTEREMYYKTEEILNKNGLFKYEISNYARPGFECRHNIGYWTDVPYIGLGLGASSYFKGTRYKNTDDLEKYLKDSYTPERIREERVVLTDDDRRSEFMILGLRMTNGVSLDEYQKKFNRSLLNDHNLVIKKYEDLGLLKIEDNRLKLTNKGVSVSNTILAEFI